MLAKNTQGVLTLSLLEAGIFFVDDIQFTLPAYNFTLGASFFDGCSYFHCSRFKTGCPATGDILILRCTLLIPENDSAPA
jgi:hypothetical protein